MIKSKKELHFYLMADRMMNKGVFTKSLTDYLKGLIAPDYIMLYLESMRKLSYYSDAKGGINRLISAFWRFKYRRLGLKLGFSIGYNVFGYGLVIPHYGTIVIGHSNVIGNYCVLHTSICISDNHKVIGNGLYCSTGVKMTSPLTLGNGISIGANSVVNKSVEQDNVMIAGAPAKVIKSSIPWYERDGTSFKDRVLMVDKLKMDMGL